MSEKQFPEDNSFHLAAASALSTCQLVEHFVKFYLSVTHQLIDEKVGKQIPYHFSGEDYEDIPLGGLLKTFKKLNDNVDLQSRLEIFRKDRNWIAHQLFADYFKTGQTKEHQDKVLERLGKIEVYTSKLIAELMLEVKKVREASGKPELNLTALLQKAADEI
jgi:hypothetical protein